MKPSERIRKVASELYSHATVAFPKVPLPSFEACLLIAILDELDQQEQPSASRTVRERDGWRALSLQELRVLSTIEPIAHPNNDKERQALAERVLKLFIENKLGVVAVSVVKTEGGINKFEAKP